MAHGRTPAAAAAGRNAGGRGRAGYRPDPDRAAAPDSVAHDDGAAASSPGGARPPHHGATSVLADSNTAAAALHNASQLLPGTGLARERWIALVSRRDAATQQRWDRALELGRAELPLVGDPHERVALLLEVATIEELVSGDLAHARHALEEAREIDPANVAVLEALI